MDPQAELLREIRAMRSEFAQLRELVAPLAVRQRSREQQAKKAGVHRSTLYRREQRAKARLALIQPPAPLRRAS